MTTPANIIHALDAANQNDIHTEVLKIMGITIKPSGHLHYPSNQIKQDFMLLAYGGQMKTPEGIAAQKLLLSAQ